MKRKVLPIVFVLFILCTVAFAQEAKKYDVNFKNISMKEFITFVASFTETNIVYNEADLRGTVSIASQYPMDAAAIMEIFYATLYSNNLAAVQEDGYIRVVPDKDMPIYDDPFRMAGNAEGEEFVTTIITLKNYNVTALANTFARVKSKHGHVEVLRGVNGILVRDFGSRIDKIREISRIMDNYATNYNLYSMTLQNVTASKMEQQVIKFFNELLKNAMTAQVPIILSDDIANVLIIAANEDDFNKIQYLIEQMDVKTVSESTLPKIFYLRYANAEDMEKVLNKIFTGAPAPAAPPGARPLSASRTSVSFDKGTNSIIALGDSEFYSNLEKMIEKLDIPRKQVYVEALILETSLDRGDNFGVEWFGAVASGSSFGFINSGSSGAVSAIASGGTPKLPSGFSAGMIGDVVMYNGKPFPSLGAFLSAVRSDTGVNIVSNPQILTLDNEEAEVFVGENRPYMTSEKYDSNDNAIQTFDYRNVGIRLKVTPHIVGTEMVNLDIDQEVNKVYPGMFESPSPITLSRTTKTKVQLYDRTIMVISGLMKDDSSAGTTGIPFLSRIPILGWLFKTVSVTSEKTNLMVFITTHIIDTKEDVDQLMERRVKGTSMFNRQVEDLIDDKMGKEDSSFIPLQKEVDDILYPKDTPDREELEGTMQ